MYLRRWLGSLACLLATACGPGLPEVEVAAPAVDGASDAALRPGIALSLTLQPASVPADGASSIGVFARLTDATGRPLTGKTVSFSSSASANDLLSPAVAVTDCKGVAHTAVASNLAGTRRLTAQRSATRAQVSLSFTCPGIFRAPIGWPQYYAAPNAGNQPTSADLNGDGNPDVVLSNYSGKAVSVLLGNGNGSFAPVVQLPAAGPAGTALCDLNKDGNLDIAAAAFDLPAVQVFLGKGDGKFAPAVSTALPASPYNVACVDLNKDGNLDLVVGLDASYFVTLRGNGDGSLQAPVSYTAGPSANGIATGDINGDGWPDVACANYDTTTVSILLNNGAGALGAATNVTVGYYPAHPALADLNGDGKLDLIVATNGDDTLFSLLGTGSGNFTLRGTVPTLSYPYWLELGDVDGDGIFDAVVGSNQDGGFSTHLGVGNGNFLAGSTSTATGESYGHRLVDLNGDGSLDLFVSQSLPGGGVAGVFLNPGNGAWQSTPNTATSYAVYRVAMGKYAGDSLPLLAATTANDGFEVRLSNGDGSFTAPTVYTGINNSRECLVSDFNNDGKADVAVAAAGAGIYLYLGNGDGTLRGPSLRSSGATPVNLAVGDFNKDGNKDLAVTNLGGPTVAILLGDGNGLLGAPVAYTVGPTPRGVSVGDINADGNLDLVVANAGSTTMSLLLGQGNALFAAAVNRTVGAGPWNVALGDLNGDGALDFVASCSGDNEVSVLLGNNSVSPSAPLAYAVGAVPADVALGDLDGDGILDVLAGATGDGTLSFLAGRGNGTLAPALSFPSGSPGATPIVLRDLNGDGRLDAVIGGYFNLTRTIPVLLNAACAPSTRAFYGNPNGSFTYSAGTVDIAAGAELIATPGDDSSTAFAGGSAAGLAWDANALSLRLGNAGGCNASGTNCAVLDPSWTPQYANLVGYWRLDGSGSVAPAGSVAGTLGPSLTVGGATVTYQGGQLAQGANLSLNGNGYFSLPAGTPNATAMTVAAWVNWNGGGINQRIFDFSQDTTHFFVVAPSTGFDSTNGMAFQVYNGSATTALAPHTLPTGAWQHVVATVNGSQAALYLNGAQVAAVSTSTTPATFSCTNNFFGKSAFAVDPYFKGSFDEVALFRTALNANEVATLYGRQAARYAGSMVSKVLGPVSGGNWSDLAWSTATPTNKALPSGGQSESASTYPGLSGSGLGAGQVLLWHLDEQAFGTAPGGLDARDDSGQGNHGKSTSAVVLGQPGQLGRGASYDGNTAVTVSRYAQFSPQLFTLSLWVNTPSTLGGEIVAFDAVTSGPSAAVDRIIYLDTTNSLRFGVYPGSYVTVVTNQRVNDGRWHHLAATLSPAGMALYVDGGLAARGTTATGETNRASYWRIGGGGYGSGWTNSTNSFVRARIDEVAIYNRALGAADIRQLWRRGANRSKFQVRVCSSLSCADNPNWQGPDNSAATYFSELNNNSLPLAQIGNVLVGAPDMIFGTFAGLSLPAYPYLQYRVALESDDANALCFYNGSATPCSPELLSVRSGPLTYASAGTVTSLSGSTLSSLTGISLGYGPGGCPGGVTFNLSNDGGVNWYWFNGFLWQRAGGSAATSSALAQLTDSVLQAFVAQRGPGPITYRAFLKSSGSAPCSLSSVTLNGMP